MIMMNRQGYYLYHTYLVWANRFWTLIEATIQLLKLKLFMVVQI